MTVLARAKLLAEIVELGTRAYGVIVDKSRAHIERERRIKDLERRIEQVTVHPDGGAEVKWSAR